MARMPQIDPLAVVATGVETGKVAGAAGLATRVRTKFLGRAKGRIETLIPGAWVNTTIRSGRIDCTGPGRATRAQGLVRVREACKGKVEKVNTNSSAAMIGWAKSPICAPAKIGGVGILTSVNNSTAYLACMGEIVV